MYCKNCGIELPDDSKFCFQCGVSISVPVEQEKTVKKEKEEKKIRTKKIIEFSEELTILNQLIEHRRSDTFSLTPDKSLIDLLSNTINGNPENADLLIINYKKKFKIGLIDDIKSLSNNYENIKIYLEPFIKLKIVDSAFPHKLLTLSDEIASTNQFTPPPRREAHVNNSIFSGSGCLKVIGVIIVLVVIVSLFMPNTEPTEVVSNSAYDASVYQVESYLKRGYLKDPDSYQGIDWSEVQITTSNTSYKYYVRHKFRAKNSYGGYEIENKIFYLNAEGNVVDYKDTE